MAIGGDVRRGTDALDITVVMAVAKSVQEISTARALVLVMNFLATLSACIVLRADIPLWGKGAVVLTCV